MFKYFLAFTTFCSLFFSASAQVLDSMTIKSPRINAQIKVTQQDVDEYIALRKITDTAGNKNSYIRIIKNAKGTMAYHPTQSYEDALINAEKSIKFTSNFSIKVTPDEISSYMTLRKITGDTAGKTKNYIKIIYSAKFQIEFGLSKLTYEEALLKAEELHRIRNMVDKVLVVKSERKMYLQKQGKTVVTFPISLGPNPVGQKEREGDGKTPEGNYYLDWQKWNSSTFHSYHISYPNEKDIERAKAKGLTPGSNIMVHGTSKGVKKKKDWTNGCIALSNKDMAEFKRIVFQDTEIEIRK